MTGRGEFERAVPLAALLLLALPEAAHADVVEPGTPELSCTHTCLPGSVPVGGFHGVCPSECGAMEPLCTHGEACAADSRCLPTRFCITRRYVGLGEEDVVAAECAADGHCDVGTCVIEARCVPTPTAPPSTAPPGSATPPTATPPTATPPTVTPPTPPSPTGAPSPEARPDAAPSWMCAAGPRAPSGSGLAFVLLALLLSRMRVVLSGRARPPRPA